MDFLWNVQQGDDFCFDIETFKSAFTMVTTKDGKNFHKFEISHRRNDFNLLKHFVRLLTANNCRMVGFNSINFDYPILHKMLQHGNPSALFAHECANEIINSTTRWGHQVKPWEVIVPQVDLYKVWHFDNVAKATSLKVLEFNMGMDNIQDLPYKPDADLTDEQIDQLMQYNVHDVVATYKFYNESTDALALRKRLSEKYGRDFTNFSDAKIGAEIFIESLGVDKCFVGGSRRTPRQTPRESIHLGDVILPYIKFKHPEFQRIHEWFKQQTIVDTKGVFTDINCTVNGFQFDFGTGGIHGAAEPGVYENVTSIDVKSYYPNLAIANNVFPEHLGQQFCDVYKELYDERASHPKGSPENAALKLALNGTYGNSNNKYSPFYDPKYTMTITINGQLLLCMLVDMLQQVPDFKILMINTDGLECIYPDEYDDRVKSIVGEWEKLTGLVMEYGRYRKLCIRDCNNYIGELTDGSIKRKGAYEHELDWHQNHSAKVVAMAAEEALLHGTDIEESIYDHRNPMDFMLRTKVPRNSKLFWGDDEVQRITRYYIGHPGGRPLKKVMPPSGTPGAYKRRSGVTEEEYQRVMSETGGEWHSDVCTANRSKYETREVGINTGWNVTVCNTLTGEYDFNYDYYIKEAEKITNPLLTKG